MAIGCSELEQILVKAFPDGKVEVIDLAGDMEHYAIKVISSRFIGRSRIECHKMVYEVLKNREIHALQIKTCVEG